MSTKTDRNARERQQSLPMTKAGVFAGAGLGQLATARAEQAGRVAEAILASHPKQAAASTAGDFVARRSQEIVDATREAAAAGLRSGAFEQVKGHFIEGSTIRDYTAKGKLVGKSMVGRNSPTNKAYDASRFIVKDGRKQFAGAVQIKSSSGGVEKAISQIERVKPRSVSNATLIVPEDQLKTATKKAAGRINVKGNGVTRAQSTKRLDRGLGDLAAKGTSATSKLQATAKAGAIGAAINVGFGAATEAGKLKRGEISARHFAEDRGVDAAEGASGAVICTAVGSVASAGATAALGTAAGSSFAAAAGTAGTAVVTSISSMGAGGAVVGGALSTLSAPVVIPAVAGIAVSVAIGFGFSKGFEAVRGAIDDGRAKAKAEADRVATELRLNRLRAEHRALRLRGDHDPRRRFSLEMRIRSVCSQLEAAPVPA